MVAERARLFETHQKREYMDETDVTGLKLLSQLGVWLASWLAGWLASGGGFNILTTPWFERGREFQLTARVVVFGVH
eukprot:427667-Prymnesium_polylepis.1